MSSETKYRQKWLKYHKSYEKRAYKLLRGVFKKWNKTIINTQIDENLYKAQITMTISDTDMYNAYYDIYYNIGKIHGKRVGKSINNELQKDFTLIDFMRIFEQELPYFLRNYAIQRIQLVHQSYLNVIFEMFNDRLKEGKTLKETTEEIFKVMQSPRFYKWEAERIARTETTSAANYAAIKAGKNVGYVVEKQWISGSDARVRRKPKAHFDHFEMNGKKVGINEMFVFNENTLDADMLEYAGDVRGKAGNVINCRCTVAIVPKRDKNGRLIRLN